MVEQKETDLLVKIDRAQYRVPGIDPENFAGFPDIKGEPVCEFTMPAEDLKEGLNKTGFAVAKGDESRVSLTGACLRGLGDKLHIVASNGHRLALYEVLIAVPEFVSILPMGAVKILSKLEDGEVRVRKFKEYIVFESHSATYTIREIDGGYPDYLSVIPPEDKLVCKVELYKEDLKRALERMVKFSKELKRFGGVAFHIQGGKLLLEYADPEEGEGKEEVELTYVEGEEMKTGFNPKYILEYLKKVEPERVWMKFTGEDTACVMGDEFKYLVMPMRV